MALKIAASESNESRKEMKILRHLSTESQQQHPGNSCVMTLLNSFKHQGPNGVHECFVFEVMGPSAGSYIREFSWKTAQPGRPLNGSHERVKPQLSVVKSILRQTLLGIDYLHKRGIVHSDLQPGNVLLSIKDLSLTEESRLAQYDKDGAHFVKVPDSSGHERFKRTYKDDWSGEMAGLELPSAKRQKTRDDSINSESMRDGSSSSFADPQGIPMELKRPLIENSKPRYLALERPLDELKDLVSPVQVKISDMGGAFFLSNPPEMPVTPLNMRSPEFILGHPIGQAQDIWSFGCLIFELIADRPLFIVDPFDYSKMSDSFGSEGDYPGNENNDDDDDAKKHEARNGNARGDHANIDQGDDILEEGKKEEEKEKRIIEPAAIPPNPLEKEEDKAGKDENSPEEPEFDFDGDHLQQFARIIRPLPPSLLTQWPKASSFFQPNGEAKHVKGDDLPPWYSLEDLLNEKTDTPVDMSSATERDAVKHLIREILQYEPENRPSASRLLQHPWFSIH